MPRYSFVAKMPDEPGMMHRAADIVQRHEGNIERVHYDRRIDAHTVFFEVLCPEAAYRAVEGELRGIGFLQTSLAPLSFLKLHVYLANRSGSLTGFLERTTAARANIAYMDFDEREHPERLTVSLTLEGGAPIDNLLDDLKPRYRLEVLEYDTSGKSLDDTVFYLRFAQQLREIIGEAEDEFLFHLLRDINRIVQALTKLGQDHRQVFESVLLTGRTLRATAGDGFYIDVQSHELSRGSLVCAQLPCGGSVHLIRAQGGTAMVDTGYGIYAEDLRALLRESELGDPGAADKVLITHGDADHAGAGGFLEAEAVMHPGTLQVLSQSNRAYGSSIQDSILEEVYTRLINLFSNFRPPRAVALLDEEGEERDGPFQIVGRLQVAGLAFKALRGLDGHIHGQTYYVCEEEGLLFTGDTLLNLSSFTPERQRFSELAKVLMTTVDVDSTAAAREREGLLEIAARLDERMKLQGRRCLVCGGHGAVSVLEGGRVRAYGQALRVCKRA